MLKISVDNNKISKNLKASVSVESDYLFDAVEVRATKKGEPYMRGLGYNLIADEKSVSADGTVYLASPVSLFSFVVAAEELDSDGEYRISVYVRNTQGAWNDVCMLYTSEKQQLTDVNGAVICVCRAGTGTDEEYISTFTGAQIDDFIKEVFSDE